MRQHWFRRIRFAIATAFLPFIFSCGGSSPTQPPSPACSLNTTSLAFGQVAVGQAVNRSFTVTNTGGGTLTGTVTSGCAAYTVVGNAGYSLGANASANITIRFAPSQAGEQDCSLSAGAAGCGNVACTGTGYVQSGGSCGVSPGTLDFGSVTVGQSADRQFTITNNTASAVTGTAVSGCAAFSIVGNAAYSLAPGASSNVVVRFTPSVAGKPWGVRALLARLRGVPTRPQAASLQQCTITTGCGTVSCSGTGVASSGGSCTVSPTALDFGTVNVGQSADRQFRVANHTSSGISGTVSSPCAAFTVVGNASYSLSPGDSATFTLRFSPTSAGKPAVTRGSLRGPGAARAQGAQVQTCTVSTGCASVSCTGTGASTGNVPDWTFMVYMAADNTLAAAGLDDLDEMEAAGVSPRVNVVVQAEFSPTSLAQAGCADPSCFNRPNFNTFRYHIDGTGAPHKGPNGPAADIGNVDMTDPATLTSFVNWAKQNYPAQHYALVLWNHGGGYLGLLADETTHKGHFMSLEDLRGALAASGKIDVLNFDMCLMAGYETMAKVQGQADYVVFSEETEPGAGNPYDQILGALNANTAMTPKTLATTIADKYNQSFQGDRASTTISAYDMSGYAAFETALGNLARDLTAKAGTLAPLISQVSAHSQKYEYPMLKDLGCFLDSLSARVSNDTLKSEIAAVKAQDLGTFRLRSLARNGGDAKAADVSRSTGIHVCLPSGQGDDVLPNEGGLSFASYKQLLPGMPWTTFLESYLGSQTTAAYVDQGDSRFETYLVWDPNAVPQGADLDFWILEPNGNIYIPVLGTVTPNGDLTGDSRDTGQYFEGYLSKRYIQVGQYRFYASLATDPNDYEPVFQLAYRLDQSSPFQGLFSQPLPRMNLSVSWRNDPSPSLAKAEQGYYSDLVYLAYFNAGPTGSPARRLEKARSGSGATADSGKRPTAAQLATVRRLLSERRVHSAGTAARSPRGPAGLKGLVPVGGAR